MRELNLGLVPTQPAQVLRLREPEAWAAEETPSAARVAAPQKKHGL